MKKREETTSVVPLADVLPNTLASIKNIRERINERDSKKVFFAKIGDARILRTKGAKKIVVLVKSAEEASTAISEGFSLALREYVWTDKNNQNFRGFLFFVSSQQDAEKIKGIIPSQGLIPKEGNCRVSFCAMHKNVNLRWLARRFIQQKLSTL